MICKGFCGIVILKRDPVSRYHIRRMERTKIMPREDRRIYFDHDETYKAIYQLCGQKGLPRPPAGYIVAVEANMESPLELDFVLETQRSSSNEAVRYTRDFVVAALMIYCRTIGIPLPKGANKTLELAKDTLTLRVQMIR